MFHQSKYIELHGESIEIDLKMIEIITKLNKKKLITRGCCENWYNKGYAYINFEYNSFIELYKNILISKFVNKFSNKGEIYYALNDLRHIKYNELEYNEKYKNETEIWICIEFPSSLINIFVKIIDNSGF